MTTLFDTAKKYIPGGVNSPVRAFNGVGGEPVFIKKASGAYIFDTDDTKYIDYVGSWGPMVLGHAHPDVISAVKSAANNGLGFGAPTEIETEVANKICSLIPSIDLVRMVSSGTEATMSAIRLARGFTHKDKIIKFEGCYHGHSDSLLVKAGSGALTLGVPSSPGVPASLAKHTITVPYNDLKSFENAFVHHKDDLACVIIEPVAGNMNCILPVKGFLEGVRELCTLHDVVLIFDEVMTGFRTALGGAQSIFNIQPDLTTLGKVIGGGLPVGAFGGKREIMEQIAPLGPVYQAGTLSGNPVAMAAGLKTLELISEPGFFEALSENVEKLVIGLLIAAKDAGIELTENHIGGMFGLFFSSEQVVSFEQATQCNVEQFKSFFHGMLNQSVYFAPSAYETGFMSASHTNEDIEYTINAAAETFSMM